MCLLTFKRTEHLSAFTLAETLITLVILGVIAALTIPALMAKCEKMEEMSAAIMKILIPQML